MYPKQILLLLICFLPVLNAQAQIYGDGLVINEFMASADSVSGIADPAGQFDDWIELYNNGNITLNLENFTLSDKLDNPGKWVFPSGISLAAGGYLIIWADEDQAQEGYHSNFKLGAAGEALILSNPFGEVLDSLTFGQQETNIAFARRPNGTGNFLKQNQTWGFNNDLVNSTGQRPVFKESGFILSPNPATSEVALHWQLAESPEVRTLEILDYSGQVIQRQSWGGQSPISLAGLSAGAYLVRITTDEGMFGARLIKQ